MYHYVIHYILTETLYTYIFPNFHDFTIIFYNLATNVGIMFNFNTHIFPHGDTLM